MPVILPSSALIALPKPKTVLADLVAWAGGAFCLFAVRARCGDEESLERRDRVCRGLDISLLKEKRSEVTHLELIVSGQQPATILGEIRAGADPRLNPIEKTTASVSSYFPIEKKL